MLFLNLGCSWGSALFVTQLWWCDEHSRVIKWKKRRLMWVMWEVGYCGEESLSAQPEGMHSSSKWQRTARWIMVHIELHYTRCETSVPISLSRCFCLIEVGQLSHVLSQCTHVLEVNLNSILFKCFILLLNIHIQHNILVKVCIAWNITPCKYCIQNIGLHLF